MMSPERPTLLVFTLGAPCESRRRKLLPASWGAVEERLHHACLETALAAGRGAGCRLEVSSPEPLELPADAVRRQQTGKGFAARLDRAVADAFAASAGPVVVVGGDIPGLRAEHVRRTVELLREDPERVVLGPSPDGGFYLVAAARPLGGVLAGVCWCCPKTLESLRRALAREGRAVVLLPTLADLDRRADLERLLAAPQGPAWAAWRRLFALLRELLRELRRPRTAPPPPRRRFRDVRLPPLRAPPAFA